MTPEDIKNQLSATIEERMVPIHAEMQRQFVDLKQDYTRITKVLYPDEIAYLRRNKWIVETFESTEDYGSHSATKITPPATKSEYLDER